MVKQGLLFLVLLVTTAYAAAEDTYEEGDNYWEPRPYKVTQVKSLTMHAAPFYSPIMKERAVMLGG